MSLSIDERACTQVHRTNMTSMAMPEIESRHGYHRALLARLPLPGQSAWQFTNTHPIPTLNSGQLRIKTTHVALNPFDWQMIAYKFGMGPEAKVMGRDGSGIVVEVGSKVGRFRAGDRVSKISMSKLTARYGFVPTQQVPTAVLSKSIPSILLARSVIPPPTSLMSKLLHWGLVSSLLALCSSALLDWIFSV